MRLINPLPKPLITLVACMHGNEQFGLRVIEAIEKKSDLKSFVQMLIANEEAVADNKRFLEKDLNRAFGRTNGNSHEEKLAIQILPIIKSSTYVLDIHTTTSKIDGMVPIVTNLDQQTRKVLNLCRSTQITWIQKPLSEASLIGQVKSGVSLEFQEEYSRTTEALNETLDILTGLIENTHLPERERDIYHITHPAPSDLILPPQTLNYVFSETLQGYPFLVGERAYPNGLVAKVLSRSRF